MMQNLIKKNTSQIVKHADESIMLWDRCAGPNCTGNISLVWMDGRNGLNKYQQILKANSASSVKKGEDKEKTKIPNTPKNPQWTTSRRAS